MSVVEYVKQLQNRSKFLDGEMKKILDTIRQSGDMVNMELTSGSGSGSSSSSHNGNSSHHHHHHPYSDNSLSTSVVGNDADLFFVKGLDFKAIFDKASIALGIASLDGTFIRCNAKFERVSGYTKTQLLKLSVFGMLAQTEIEQAYKAVGRFLKEEDTFDTTNTGTGTGTGGQSQSEVVPNDQNSNNNDVPGYWCGRLCRPNDNLQINISLSRTAEGAPKFLHCSLSVIDMPSVMSLDTSTEVQ
mmetsp:Transcript_11876/g.13239  ORF Transcript_11876/g.13239 Transcript_11876/m.13239 type:complete len:244 (-) Transcript_11876:135-866(-)